jgi:hypothetical protein
MYLNSDLHTQETFPIGTFTLEKVIGLVNAEIDGILTSESSGKWDVATGEWITGLLLIRDIIFEGVRVHDLPITTQLNEGTLRTLDSTITASAFRHLMQTDEDGNDTVEATFREFIWDEIQDKCATCGNDVDYCPGHGVLG